MCFFFPFLPTDPFISENINVQLGDFSSFMWSCSGLDQHETIFWSHSIFAVREAVGLFRLVFLVGFFSRALC